MLFRSARWRCCRSPGASSRLEALEGWRRTPPAAAQTSHLERREEGEVKRGKEEGREEGEVKRGKGENEGREEGNGEKCWKVSRRKGEGKGERRRGEVKRAR